MESTPLILSTQAYEYLARPIAHACDFFRGRVERRRFPDGELYQRLVDPVSDRDVYLVGGTISEGDTLELFDLACAVAKYGARALTILIPYYGWSTMERAAQAGEVVTAKTRARLISSIPPADRGNRVMLLDLHNEGTAHYFEGDVTPMHVSAKPVVAAAIRELGGDDFVLACTDAGRAKWVQRLANELGVPPAFVFKRRLSGSETDVSALSAQVEGERVVIYDDMIRSGSSLLEAARAYREAGASSLAAVATHGVLPGDSLVRIRASGYLDALVCTDSHPRARELEGDFLRVESVADLLAWELRGDVSWE